MRRHVLSLVSVAALTLAVVAGCGQSRRQGDPNGEAVTVVVRLDPAFLHDLRTHTASTQGAGASSAVPIGSHFGVPLTATTVSLLGGDAPGEAQIFWHELAWGETRFTVPLRPGRIVTLTLKAEGGHQGLADCGTLVIPRAAGVEVDLRLDAAGERLALLPPTPGAVRLPGSPRAQGVASGAPARQASAAPGPTTTEATTTPSLGGGDDRGAGNLAPSPRTVITADPEGLVPPTGPVAAPSIPAAPLAPAPAPHAVAPAPRAPAAPPASAPTTGAQLTPAAPAPTGGVDVHLGGMAIARDAASGPGAGIRGQAAPPAPPAPQDRDRTTPTPAGSPERLQVHIGIAPPGPAVAPVSPVPDPSHGDP